MECTTPSEDSRPVGPRLSTQQQKYFVTNCVKDSIPTELIGIWTGNRIWKRLIRFTPISVAVPNYLLFLKLMDGYGSDLLTQISYLPDRSAALLKNKSYQKYLLVLVGNELILLANLAHSLPK